MTTDLEAGIARHNRGEGSLWIKQYGRAYMDISHKKPYNAYIFRAPDLRYTANFKPCLLKGTNLKITLLIECYFVSNYPFRFLFKKSFNNNSHYSKSSP